MNMIVNMISIEAVRKIPPSYGERLFPKRMEKARRFKQENDQLRCIGAGILMHDVLSIKEEELSYNAHQKPQKKDTFFNLSHSGHYVIAVQDEDEIGCDIEIINPAHMDIARKVFLPEEIEWMNEKDSASRFFTLWTLKESVMKQQGKGLALAPETFSVLPFLQGNSILINGTKLFGKSIEHEGHIISVCATHVIEKIEIRTAY